MEEWICGWHEMQEDRSSVCEMQNRRYGEEVQRMKSSPCVVPLHWCKNLVPLWGVTHVMYDGIIPSNWAVMFFSQAAV